MIAAEDTRSMRRLLEIHGVALGGRPVIAYHDHNGDAARPRLMAYLEEGASVAYASEAGTPLIADPGYDLARAASDAGHLVTSAPGPSAIITALTLAGLPTDAFFFGGFLPNSSAARRSKMEALREVPGTLVFYESPKRVAAMLVDAGAALGAGRSACVARELTKKFEEIKRGTLQSLAQDIRDMPLKGEVVVLIDRAHSEDISKQDLTSDLKVALRSMRVRDAAETVAKAHGVPKRQVYQMALQMGKEDGERSD